MTLRVRRAVLLAVMMGFVATLSSLVLLKMSPVLALERERTGPVKQVAPKQAEPPQLNIVAVVVFTDPAIIDIQDLAGNVSQGTHVGKLRCNINCSQKTQLQSNGVTYEYKFKTRQAVDPVARRLIVAGTGTINSNDQRERFLFTATFEDNRDGTVWVRYEASGSDASFIIPASPGTFSIISRR